MSTSVSSSSEQPKNRGHGNNLKSNNGKIPNSSKDHYAGDHDEVDSWRNQASHHQVYAAPMGSGSDPYMPPYYGSFQYSASNFSVDAPWTGNGTETGFVSGYSQQHDSGPSSGQFNNVENGMFAGGNLSGGYSNFGLQPGFGYGYPGNGEYNTWGPRRGYDGYYSDERNMKVIDGMGTLSINERRPSFKESKDFGSKKTTTWASIASQPAKPTSLLKKKTSMGGIPQPPIMLGAWDKNGTVPKASILAPVQAPHPTAWERMDRVNPKASPTPPPSMNVNSTMQPSKGVSDRTSHAAPVRGYNLPSHGNPMGFNHSQHPPQSQPTQLISHPQSHNPGSFSNSTGNKITETIPSDKPSVAAGATYPDETKMKSDYNPAHFDLNAEGARFFVIKSYSEDDIHRSIKYEIWCSTDHGNKRLDQAWCEREGKGPIFLFFSVNSSGHFCGMAQMMSSVDYDASSSVWCQDKWKGQFKVKWVYVKDVPNAHLRHIRLENNENKPVTNSRDTQEVPFEKGKQVLKILHTFHHTTSIFDDFVHYEKRQEEEDQRKVTVTISKPMTLSEPLHERADRGGSRGGYQHRGGAHHNDIVAYHSRDRDFQNPSRDNPRDDYNKRGHQRDAHNSDRVYHGSINRGVSRSSDHGLGDKGFDKMNDRDFYRGRDHGDRSFNDRGPRREPRN